MSNSQQSNRTRLASEAEAEAVLNFLFSVLVAIIGGLYLVFSTSGDAIRTSKALNRDIFAPKRKISKLMYIYQNLSEEDQDDVDTMFGIAFILGVILVIWKFLDVIHMPGTFIWVPIMIILTILGVIILALAVFVNALNIQTFLDAHPEFNAFIDVPGQYVTLFRDGDTSLVNPDFQYTTYTIRIARGMEWNAERNIRFMEQIVSSFQPLLFRISADHRCIVWQIVDLLGRKPEVIERAIRVVYPEAQITTAKAHDTEPLTQDISRLTLLYHPISPFVHPLKYSKDVKDFNPLAGVVNAMNGLEQGERITFNLFVVGVHPTAHEEGEAMTRQSTIRWTDYLTIRGWRTIAYLKSTGLDTVERYVPRDQKVVEDKLRELLYQSLIAIQVDSTSDNRVVELVDTVDSQMFGFAHMPYNALRWYTGMKRHDEQRTPPSIHDLMVHLKSDSNPLEGSLLDRITHLAECNVCAPKRMATRFILTAQEMALFWHIPDEEFTNPRISWLSSRIVPPPIDVMQYSDSPRKHTFLGNGMSGGKPKLVTIPIHDRESHMRVVGKTGVGKSSFLQARIKEDIEKGFGVAVIDPHGSLVDSVLKFCIPPNRVDDVVVIDLADHRNPPPLNPLRGGLTDVQIGQVVQIIEQMFPKSHQLPRLSYYLRVALFTLNVDPDATIRDVVRIFTHQAYRASLIEKLEDDDVITAWEDYDKMREAERRSITDPIRTRISRFFSNPDLAPMMCHPKGLDFEAMIRAKKIILVSLKMNEQLVPEAERNMIGSLLISRLQMSGMQEPSQVPYFVYIDEVQRFVTSSLDEMFSEARKFGLSLTVAHQFLDQLPDTTRSSLMSNTGATFLFASSPEDAQSFIPHMRPYFEIDELVSLDQFTCVARIQSNGVTQPPFTMLTALPLGLSDEVIDTNPVFSRRAELIPHERYRLDTWNQRWVEYLDCERLDILHRVIELHIRSRSHEQYTPTTRQEIITWMTARYGRISKDDNQATFIDE